MKESSWGGGIIKESSWRSRQGGVAFLAGNLPKKLSKLCVLDERGMKKSKKHRTGASPESPTTVKHT